MPHQSHGPRLTTAALQTRPPHCDPCFAGSVKTVQKFEVHELSTVMEFKWEAHRMRGVLIPASIVFEVRPDIRVEETLVQIELDGVVASR